MCHTEEITRLTLGEWHVPEEQDEDLVAALLCHTDYQARAIVDEHAGKPGLERFRQLALRFEPRSAIPSLSGQAALVSPQPARPPRTSAELLLSGRTSSS